MAKMETFEVLVPSYINEALRQPGELVTFNTDVKSGGMKPGAGLKKVKGAPVAVAADGETLSVE